MRVVERLPAVRFEGPDGKAWKIIQANPRNPRGLKETELYDVQSDPGEKQDRKGTRADVIAPAARELKAAQEDAARGRASSVSGELGSDMKTQLDALGYMEDEKKKK